jgi:aminopeptidase N
VPQPVGGFVPTADGFATAPQPAAAHTVFPCNDHPSDKAAFTFRVTAPFGTLGVANGTLAGSVTNPDGSTTSTYTSRDPIATELVQISVGRYTVVEHGTHEGAQLRDVVPVTRVAATYPALALTRGQLEWISEYLGDFPLEAYGLLVADTDDPEAFDFTGLETQTLTLYKPAYLLQAEEKIGTHMVHEIAHNWFGNSVTPKDWSDLWLNEGHANWYSLRYRYERGWPDAQGNTTFEARMKHTYAQGDIWRAKSGPVAEPTAATLFDDQRYTGGTLALYALEQRIGAAAFAELERTFVQRFRNRTASTKDYVDLAVEVSGDRGVRALMGDWLYGDKTPPMPDHPDWKVDPVPPPPPPGAPAAPPAYPNDHWAG